MVNIIITFTSSWLLTASLFLSFVTSLITPSRFLSLELTAPEFQCGSVLDLSPLYLLLWLNHLLSNIMRIWIISKFQVSDHSSYLVISPAWNSSLLSLSFLPIPISLMKLFLTNLWKCTVNIYWALGKPRTLHYELSIGEGHHFEGWSGKASSGRSQLGKDWKVIRQQVMWLYEGRSF